MKIYVSKRRWYFAILNCFFVILTLFFTILFLVMSNKLDSIGAADRWRGENDMRFAQIACFQPVDSPKTEEEIFLFRRTLDQKMLDSSLDVSGDTTLYTDAYSGQAKLTVSGKHGKADVETIGVGGNFFLFHPLQLRSGGYISSNDLMQDRVILDESLSWQLFGGMDVTGMTVYVDDQPLYVAGVIRRESDNASREAHGDKPVMYMSYNAFQKLSGVEITCYEIVMPDMISGFAMSLMKDNYDVATGDMVENSDRFSLKNLLQVIRDFGKRSMRNNGVIYPYWENAVRMTEDHLALLLVLIVISAFCPAVSIAVWSIKLIVHAFRGISRQLPERILSVRERRREEQYARTGKR